MSKRSQGEVTDGNYEKAKTFSLTSYGTTIIPTHLRTLIEVGVTDT